jgi:hypothetical protein
LSPLPSGIRVVSNVELPGGGSSEAARRLVVVEDIRDSRLVIDLITKSLSERGWQLKSADGAISPDGAACIGLDEASAYLNDPLRSVRAKRHERTAMDTPSRTYVVISMLKC